MSSTKFNHQIVMKDVSWPLNISGNSIEEKSVIVAEREFSELFDKYSKRWFGMVVLSSYPDAKMVKDNTMIGYHFESGTTYWELH